MTEAELLDRIAKTLKQEIGPAVDSEYPKTQAFMAAVVLQKLSRQLALASGHRQANGDDLNLLIDDIAESVITKPVPEEVASAARQLAEARDDNALCGWLEALYANRAALGAVHFDALLGRTRTTMRANIDRQVEYAG